MTVTMLSRDVQVFDLLSGEGGRELVARLQRNTAWFRDRMKSSGFTIKVSVEEMLWCVCAWGGGLVVTLGGGGEGWEGKRCAL